MSSEAWWKPTKGPSSCARIRMRTWSNVHEDVHEHAHENAHECAHEGARGRGRTEAVTSPFSTPVLGLPAPGQTVHTQRAGSSEQAMDWQTYFHAKNKIAGRIMPVCAWHA